MKAFLLAAGLGTRLKPLTDHIPKCLVPIGNTPLLGLWLTRLQACGVNEVLINTHHLPEKVNAFVGEYLKNAPEPGLSVTLCHELHLLGSAGTLLENRNFVKEEEVFLIVYADNLCDYDLTLLAAAQRENGKKGGLLTMALFEAPNPSACASLP